MNAAQICLLASQVAKGGTGMVAIAGQWLNVVLENLKLNRDLKMNRVTRTVTVTPQSAYGPFLLPADYLRTYDMFYPIPNTAIPGNGNPTGTPGGITQFLTLVTMEEWDAEFKDPSMANYPYEFATDMSTNAQTWSGGSQGSGTLTSAGQWYIYPMTSGSITVTHRYMKNQPDIAAPEASAIVPWFPFTDYLIKATAARMMGVTGDDRFATFDQEAEAMLRPFLIMEGDEQQRPHSVRLDPKHFHFSKGLKPTKAFPF